jgi:hypothetical protein
LWRWLPKPDLYFTSRPIHIEPGIRINRVKVLHVYRIKSKLYEEVYGHPTRYEHISGEVKCLCLACGHRFMAKYKYLHPNNPNRSIWSCGCEKRPKGTSWRVVARQKAGKDEPLRGGQPLDLVDQRFGFLEVMAWRAKQGWLCLCHKCGNTDGCYVRTSKWLVSGTVTACPDCHREEWTSRRGRHPRKPHTSPDACQPWVPPPPVVEVEPAEPYYL